MACTRWLWLTLLLLTAPGSTLPVDAPLEASLVHPQGPVFLMLFDSARPLNFQLRFSPDATAVLPVMMMASDGAVTPQALVQREVP